MSTIITDSKHYTDIANAIRLKTGASANFLPAEMAAAIEAISTGASNVVEFTAPFGRVKGDINGDGVVNGTMEDIQNDNRAVDTGLLWAEFSGFIELDDIQVWCGNVSPNDDITVITSADAMILVQHTQGTRNLFCDCVDKGVNPEYYNNWSFYKIDSLNGYFYHDIEVEGMTANSSAFLLSANHSELFEGVECMDGTARIKVKIPPVEAVECFLVWEADGTIWEDANGGFKTVDIDIPMGRMKGDINGDGQVTEADQLLLQQYIGGNSPMLSDEVVGWCSEIFIDGKFNSKDFTRILQHVQKGYNIFCGCVDAGINPEYYNNWTFVKVDNLNGYFYHDISIEGMTTSSTAVLLTSDTDFINSIEGVECLDGIARIKASLCPVTAQKGIILWKANTSLDTVVPVDLNVSASGLVTATAGAKTATHQLSSADDPNFISDNIASGVSVFGLTGTASGGIPCTLTVETGAGATVTATLENTTVTATADENGIATLILEKAGVWTVTATLDGKTATTEVDVSLSVTANLIFVDPVLENNSWETISEIAREGKASQYWNVGDTKPITVAGSTYNAQIMDFDMYDVADPTTYGREKAGIVFQYKEVVDAAYSWSQAQANANDWISNYCECQNLIPIIKYPALAKYTSSSTTIYEAKGICPSEYEVYGKIGHEIRAVGTQYAFYAAGNSRVKSNLGGTKKDWWTRSRYKGNSASYVYINILNGVSYTTNNCYCAPVFCI